MTRTNIDVDDELVQLVMTQNHLKTKKDAVDFALRHTLRRTPTVQEILALEGIGWDMTNDELEAATDAGHEPW
jgi:Arc/MetJ family transcription regulator